MIGGIAQQRPDLLVGERHAAASPAVSPLASPPIIAAGHHGVNDRRLIGPRDRCPPAHKPGDIGVRAGPRLTYRRPVGPSCAVLSAPFPERRAMNLLFRIVYAAHASGTHHKLALDALRHLEGMDADMWQRLFLAARQALPRGLEGARQRVQGLQEPRAAHARRLLGRRAGEGAQLVQSPGRGAGAAGLADGGLLRRRAQPLLHRPAATLPHRPVGGREQHPSRRRVEHLQGLRRAQGAGRGRVPQHRRRAAAAVRTGWRSSSARAPRRPTATTRS